MQFPGAPWQGMEGKVFYVWFDAPIEYIAATAEWADANGKAEADWQRWWRTDKGAEDVKYLEFMGKDNVAFHTVSFPATILGSGEPWKTVDTLDIARTPGKQLYFGAGAHYGAALYREPPGRGA